jgi:hypothetical protein
MFLGSKERSRRVRLTTLPPSVSRLSRQCWILNISQTCRSPRPVKGTHFAVLYVAHPLPPVISTFSSILQEVQGLMYGTAVLCISLMELGEGKANNKQRIKVK